MSDAVDCVRTMTTQVFDQWRYGRRKNEGHVGRNDREQSGDSEESWGSCRCVSDGDKLWNIPADYFRSSAGVSVFAPKELVVAPAAGARGLWGGMAPHVIMRMRAPKRALLCDPVRLFLSTVRRHVFCNDDNPRQL